MPDFDSFTRISYTTDFSAFCSVGLAGFVGGELSLSESINCFEIEQELSLLLGINFDVGVQSAPCRRSVTGLPLNSPSHEA